jgi:RNA-binding protein
MPLSGKQRRHLRSLGHHLDALVQVGKLGVEPGLLAAVDRALLDHELVKIKVSQASPQDKDEVAAALAARCNAEIAQVLGHSILLYRPHPDAPRIQLPKGRPGGAAGGAAGVDDDDTLDEATLDEAHDDV